MFEGCSVYQLLKLLLKSDSQRMKRPTCLTSLMGAVLVECYYKIGLSSIMKCSNVCLNTVRPSRAASIRSVEMEKGLCKDVRTVSESHFV